MAGTRVVLAACRQSAEGPWVRANGHESQLKITGLAKGEHVILCTKSGELEESFVFYQGGVFPLPFQLMESYRVDKHVGVGVVPSSTTVEVILNGGRDG
jgi:hypothetical protein